MRYPDDTDIYEHGIISTSALSGLALLATTRHLIYSGYSLAIVDTDGSSLNERAIRAGSCPVTDAVKDFHEESDMRYCIRATLII